MTKFLTIFIVLFTLVSCGVKEGEYKIEGTAKGLADDTKLFINIQDEKTQSNKTIDTAKIKDGKFLFEGKLPAEAISMATLTADGQPVNQMFILENGKIVLSIEKDSTHLNKIGGTKNNDYFQAYNDKMKEIQKKGADFEKQNKAAIAEAQAKAQTGDMSAMMALQAKFEPLMKEITESSKKYNNEFVEKNKDSFISLLILNQMLMDPEADTEKLKSTFEKMDKSIKDLKPGKDISKKFEGMGKVAIGKKAPDFTSKTADGVDYILSANLGKVTLIDFWASWCGPCRMENPNVVAVYNEFKDKGLKIIGVSLDEDKAKWLEAIQADKLTWDHVAQLDPQNDVAAKLYNVASIPSTFLLDANGNIVAKNLKGDDLKNKIAELLK
jgi:thiol-disulfide isomerase/thioredoxin